MRARRSHSKGGERLPLLLAFVAVSSTAMLSATSAASAGPALHGSTADSGFIRAVPKFALDQPLTAEVLNQSKMPVRLSAVTLTFAGSSSRCDIKLTAPVDIGPTDVAIVTLADHLEVMRCLQQARGGKPHKLTAPFVMTDSDLARHSVRDMLPPGAQLQDADVIWTLEVGTRVMTSSARWHFPLQQ